MILPNLLQRLSYSVGDDQIVITAREERIREFERELRWEGIADYQVTEQRIGTDKDGACLVMPGWYLNRAFGSYVDGRPSRVVTTS